MRCPCGRDTHVAPPDMIVCDGCDAPTEACECKPLVQEIADTPEFRAAVEEAMTILDCDWRTACLAMAKHFNEQADEETRKN